MVIPGAVLAVGRFSGSHECVMSAVVQRGFALPRKAIRGAFRRCHGIPKRSSIANGTGSPLWHDDGTGLAKKSDDTYSHLQCLAKPG
jgi:hypothetical protein